MAISPKDLCHKDLERRILVTDLKPGEVLDEVNLCEVYGISRTPLREVLHRLAGDGLVTLAPNRGAKVASMDLPTLRVFFRTAPGLYAAVSRLAAQNRTDLQMTELRQAQVIFKAAVRDQDMNASALANHDFNFRIGQMAANPYLQAALTRVLVDHTRLSQTFYTPQDRGNHELIAQVVLLRDDLIEALDARHADRAVTVTADLWSLSRDAIEQFVRPDPLVFDVADTF